MRQVHARVLAAQGVHIGKALAVTGVRVRTAHDHSGTALLVLRGKLLGPNWVSVAYALDQAGIDYSLVEVGKIWLVTADSQNVRECLTEISRKSNQSSNEQVLVPDVGFVFAGSKKKVEARILIGPIVVAIISFGLTLVPTSTPSQVGNEQPVEPAISCLLDLPGGEIRDWIKARIDDRNQKESPTISLQSDLGDLNLEIIETLGSTQSISGTIECDDGRSMELHYRLDSSASGVLVELGQKLDP